MYYIYGLPSSEHWYMYSEKPQIGTVIGTYETELEALKALETLNGLTQDIAKNRLEKERVSKYESTIVYRVETDRQEILIKICPIGFGYLKLWCEVDDTIYPDQLVANHISDIYEGLKIILTPETLEIFYGRLLLNPPQDTLMGVSKL